MRNEECTHQTASELFPCLLLCTRLRGIYSFDHVHCFMGSQPGFVWHSNISLYIAELLHGIAESSCQNSGFALTLPGQQAVNGGRERERERECSQSMLLCGGFLCVMDLPMRTLSLSCKMMWARQFCKLRMVGREGEMPCSTPPALDRANLIQAWLFFWHRQTQLTQMRVGGNQPERSGGQKLEPHATTSFSGFAQCLCCAWCHVEHEESNPGGDVGKACVFDNPSSPPTADSVRSQVNRLILSFAASSGKLSLCLVLVFVDSLPFKHARSLTLSSLSK
eukprot:2112845-Amphidinium_carterae.1